MRLIVSLPLSLAAGVAVGHAVFRAPAPPVSVAAVVRHTEEGSSATPLPSDAPGTTEAKVQRLIAAALDKGSRENREMAMYLAIEALTAEDFRQLTADGGALKTLGEKMHGVDDETTGPLASALIARWLAVDPGGVTASVPRLLELLPAKENFRGFILDALAKQRPAEMLALVPARKDAAGRAEIISRALYVLAAHDLPKARAWLERCTDPADRPVAEKAVRLGTVQGDPLRAVELAAAIDNREEARDLLAAAAAHAAKMGPGVLRQLATMPMPPWMLSPMLTTLGQYDPGLAVDLALKSTAEGKGGSDDLRVAFASLAKQDAAQAIAKLEGLSGAQLAMAVSSIGSTWAERDPVAALTWLLERPASGRGGVFGDSLSFALGRWVDDAPQDARAWADALPAGEARDQVQRDLAGALAEHGHAAEAAQLLAGMGSGAKPNDIWIIGRAWGGNDPQAAADWAIAQPPGPMQSRALAGVVTAWADRDPDGVQDWLAQFPAGEARDHSVEAYLSRMGASFLGNAERNAEFDTWFDLIDDPWLRARAAANSFSERHQHDPAGARAWLSALPNVDEELIRITLDRSSH